MIDLLLNHGADPNQDWFGTTPWQYALSLIHNSDFSDERLGVMAEIFKMMLRYGADPYATCPSYHGIINNPPRARDLHVYN
jgi:ankyrin repeat protein